MHRYLTVLFVSAALAGSVSARADDPHPGNRTSGTTIKTLVTTTSGTRMKTRCTTNT
jgi:hypothetical protein